MLSPAEDVLYVSDNGAPQHVVAYDVAAGRATNRRVFAPGTPDHPDGLAVDACGRLYASAANGIHVFSRGGELLAEIELPGAVKLHVRRPRSRHPLRKRRTRPSGRCSCGAKGV